MIGTAAKSLIGHPECLYVSFLNNNGCPEELTVPLLYPEIINSVNNKKERKKREAETIRNKMETYRLRA
jgi:hypothetical protein